MKISALRLHNVKRFAARGVAIEGIGDGVNVLCAANEFGKSTSFEALHAVFFQPHSGTPAPVQALRPYSGGSPLVEVDVATEKGRFRITKQYYAGKSARIVDLDSGRVVAQADEAENFIRDLLKGGTAGPAGLLWVRQGMTGIEQRKPAEEEREKQVRASLLESVQGEVEAVTGGRRMAEIMAKTQGALAELVTATGRPKVGGRYEAAIRERDALKDREDKLGADVRALRGFLDSRAATLKALDERDSEEDRFERKRAIETAQINFDAANAQAERLRTAEAELRLARERRDAAGRELTSFREALATAARLQTDLDAAERLGSEAVARRSAALEAIEASRRKAEAAELEAQEARLLLERLRSALRARESAERLVELADRLEKAEAAQRVIEENEARLVHMKLPSQAVEDLQAIEIEIASRRAVSDAGRPSVAIVYEPGAHVRVAMDGVPLGEGVSHSYEAKAELSVPGVGTIVLRADRPTDGAGAIASAEERRRTLLSSMALPDLAAARERQVQVERMESQIREARGRLSALAPHGLTKLREAVAAHRPADGSVLEPKGDPDDAAAALLAAEKRRVEANEATRSAEPIARRAEEAFVETRTGLARLEAESAQIAAILGPLDGQAVRGTALATAHRDAEDCFRDTSDEAERLRSAGVDPASANATLKRLRSVGEAAEKDIARLRETLVDLNAQIRARADEAVEESWRESAEALAVAAARVAAFEREVATLKRLSAALETARSQARELYLKPVMTELKPLLGLLFDDVSIVFDERTLLPQTISRGGLHEEVDRLSGGMREQLSVLTRLAFARLLAREGHPAPVILDDALVYSDDDRIERMFDALHRQSSDQQIIVFSCRQRAFQRLGGNVLQLTNWQP